MRIVFACFSIALTLAAAASPASAREAAVASDPAAAQVHVLDTVVVSGLRPGPGLWKVSRGDHALWILGTVSPVPKRMEWYSPQSEALLRQAQEIIGVPRSGVQVGWSSAFKVALAMPSILRARELPDRKTLRDVLPAELHARWLTLKAEYLGHDKAVEKWRPIFAADKLYQAAMEDAGLQTGTGTGKRIAVLAGKYKIKQTSNLIIHEVRDPKKLAKSLARAEIDDVACFRSVLDRLERDVTHAASRANAWAIGNVPELSRLVRNDRLDSCLEALKNTEVMRSTGLHDATARAEAKWLASVDAALSANRVSFATLPMGEILDADGLLARLRGKGYEVLAPQQ